MQNPRPHVTVVGLGPAGADYLSAGALAAMANAPATFLRTSRHPAAEGLAPTPSFDHLYDSGTSFDDVYDAIVEALVEAATRHAPEPVVYAVPGSPSVAERTVELLRSDERVDVTVLPGLSFLDLAWERLGLDPVRTGVRLVDAVQGADAGEGPLLVAQCWSQSLLSDIKLSADDVDGAPLPAVTLLHHLGLDDEVVATVEWWEMDRTVAPDHLTSLYIPQREAPRGAASATARLESLVATLREKCPWDRVQTHASLMPHLVEECYEVLDALSTVVDAGEGAGPEEFAHLEEELGDLLFQILFHARLAEEEGYFALGDVATGIHDKLVHRHPHVFGTVEADSPEQVVGNWEAIKKAEKGRTSVTEGIPSQLPSLMLASKLQRKALSVGVDVHERREDLTELLGALARHLDDNDGGADPDAPLADDAAPIEALVGELLFEVTDVARQLGVDAEQALRTRAARLRTRILAAEAHDSGDGVPKQEKGTN
jgi:tetrapyrrole methylase family protein/MazG family protein